jgi:hypothetical protein
MLQRTPEWFRARLGKVTASGISHVLAELTNKKAEAVTRRNYRRQLALERYYDTPQDSAFQSFAMAQGIAMEAEARNAYGFAYGVEIGEVGFVRHPTIEYAGASPDGFVGSDGLLEIKCPDPNAMFEALAKFPVDKKYIDQVHWQMACSPERKWADIWFYRAGCEGEAVRVERDDTYIAHLENRVKEFLAEVEADRKLLEKARQQR